MLELILMGYKKIYRIIWIFLIFYWFLRFKISLCLSYIFFFFLFVLLSKLLGFLLKVNTEHQKWPTMGQQDKIGFFFARRAKQAYAGARSYPT